MTTLPGFLTGFPLPPTGAERRAAGRLPLRRHGMLRRALDRLMLWQERAEARYALAEMDAQLLRDVGLDRATTQAEARKPFWRR